MGGFIRKRVLKKKKIKDQPLVKQSQSGPTKSEMDTMRLVNIKRKGRKSTKLGSEDDDLFLSLKTLLG